MQRNQKQDRIGVLTRTVKEIRRYKLTMRLLTTALVLTSVLTSVVYVSAALYHNNGGFTINLNKVQMTKYGLSLSEQPDMRYKTSGLSMDIDEQITNISGKAIPEDIDTRAGSNKSQDNYIAYTFYMQNGDSDVSYEYQLSMSGISNGIDEAVRVRVYVDGTPTTYAKLKSDGSGELEEDADKEFYSDSIICKERVDNFLAKEIERITVVIWLEGNDPECNDPIIGGQIRIDMSVSLVH